MNVLINRTIKTTTALFFAAALLAGGVMIGGVGNASAAVVRITINNATIALQTDANDNDIANVGDTVRVEVILTNTDPGGCVAAGTEVEVDMRKYGGVIDEGATCIIDGLGSGPDTFRLDFTVVDAGASGIDVGAANASSRVTVSAGDTAHPAAATAQTSVLANPADTIAPNVVAAAITATGMTGADDVFKIGDHPVFHWDTAAETDTIVSVTVNGADFRAGDTALVAAPGNGEFVANASGALRTIESIGNEVIVTATDDAGNTTIVTGTATYAIDTVAPSITVVRALLQNGAATHAATNNWYYYSADQRIRFTVTSGEELGSARACIKSLVNDTMMDLCSSSELINADTSIPGADVDGDTWGFDQLISGLGIDFPTLPGGYAMNLYVTDVAGNVTMSDSQANSFGAVFNINPKTMVTVLNNGGTTDWSTINDFTDATAGGDSQVVFHAAVGDTDVGELTLTGNSLNLTDQATITGLINMGNNIVFGNRTSTGAPSMGINSTALAALNIPATLQIWLAAGGQPGLVVRNDLGAIVGYVQNDQNDAITVGDDEISGFVWGEDHSLTFNTDGFSSFGADNTPPTVSLLRITGPNTLTVSYSEPVTNIIGDYTNFVISGDEAPRAFTHMDGNGTDTIVLTFNGAAVPPGSTGTMDINNPPRSVLDLVGNEMIPLIATVVDDGQAIHHSSAGNGAVITPSVTVLRPNGGEAFSAGASAGIDWSSADGAFVGYRVSYSADNGNNWTVIAASVPNMATTWTVPTASTTQGLIKVEGFGTAGAVLASDISNAVFTVLGTTVAPPPVAPPAVDPTVTGTYDSSTAKDNNPDFNTDMGLPAAPPFTAWCVSGSLIKSSSLPAVFYCGVDGKRYVFVNDKAYFSWYPDFNTVQTISDDTMAKIEIGGNITYRPGARMVKIQTDPKVYAIARGGVLRWVTSEAVAVRLYGANWNTMIDDVADAFFVNYVLGTPLY